MDKITKEVLEEWGACQSGIDLFVKHFPNGGTLNEVSIKCMELNENENAVWLFNKCRELNVFPETTIKGYGNSGYGNSGDRNSGDSNSGDRNSGHGNSGNSNFGSWNSGNSNSGYGNSGNWNSGYGNSGDGNSGGRNSGNWNSGHGNSGFFNSTAPKTIYVFNKRIDKSEWEKAEKPKFIYEIGTTYWISESKMTGEDKKNDTNFYVRRGQLKTRTYKEAWKIAYDNASKEDIEKLKKLPNFDADVFEEITGIRI